MGLFKFQNYSAIKNAQDNPRVEAVGEMVNGNIFKIVDNFDPGGGAAIIKEAAQPFDDAADAQLGNVWVTMNIVDKPETRNFADYSILEGEKVRAFNLKNLAGEMVELSGDLVIADGVDPVVVGTALVPTNVDQDAAGIQMVWKSIADPAAFATYLEVTDITAFGTFTIDNAGVGYECKIKSN